MILQTIYCSVKDCQNWHVETGPNRGFSGWGHIVGIHNDETGEDAAHLCPVHLKTVKEILNDGLD